MLRRRAMHRWLPTLGSVVALSACTSGGQSGPAIDEVTAIAPSPAVEQAIPNCWDFATAGWIEALSRRPHGAAGVDVSEGYLAYLAWFGQLVEDQSDTVSASGYWGVGVELVRRYGWMREQDFLSLPEPSAYAARHRAAYAALGTELATGALSTPARRRDRKNVIEVLNRVWGLRPSVVAGIRQAFGATMDTDLTRGAAPGSGPLHRLEEIEVGWTADGATVTAADLVGTPASDEAVSAGLRVGPFAYSALRAPSVDDDLRAFVRRAQLSLNQDIPMYMSLLEDDAFDDASGTYVAPSTGKLTDKAYGHAVLVFDETVQTTDFGLLPAGIPETRPAALASSLRDDARVNVLRARNSFWGTYEPGATIAFVDGVTGLNDYRLDYLTMKIPQASRRVLNYLTVANDPTMVLARNRP